MTGNWAAIPKAVPALANEQQIKNTCNIYRDSFFSLEGVHLRGDQAISSIDNAGATVSPESFAHCDSIESAPKCSPAGRTQQSR